MSFVDVTYVTLNSRTRLINLIEVTFIRFLLNTISTFDDYLLTLKPNKNSKMSI